MIKLCKQHYQNDTHADHCSWTFGLSSSTFSSSLMESHVSNNKVATPLWAQTAALLLQEAASSTKLHRFFITLSVQNECESQCIWIGGKLQCNGHFIYIIILSECQVTCWTVFVIFLMPSPRPRQSQMLAFNPLNAEMVHVSLSERSFKKMFHPQCPYNPIIKKLYQ